MRGRLILVVVALVAGLFFGVPLVIGLIGDIFGAETYGRTVDDVKSEYGEDAKVVSIVASGSGVHYELLGADGNVLIRNFAQTCAKYAPSNTASHCENNSDRDSRSATPADRQAARHALGEFDADLLQDMYKEAGFSSKRSSASFEGSVWTLHDGTQVWTADAGGGHLRRVQ